jgi:methylated-DNA-[protein]-cysteine S-methyltransferase
MVIMKVKYVVFSTDWGYFGLAGTDSALIRTHLPLADCNRVVQGLLAELGPASFNAKYLQELQERIKAYYKGSCADGFSDVRVNLRSMGPFTSAILRACRKIKPGRTVTYAQLAKMAGRPKAVRAVGGALARNPLPLIIPCHRVIRSDGRIGGYSAAGGTRLKQRLLEHERCVNSLDKI